MSIATSPLLSPALLAQLEKLELVTRRIFRGRMKGERRSKRKGQSVEFADFRNYVPGDDLRFIDWNTYARLDRLFLKMFFEEEDLHFYALIDASQSMDFGEPTKLYYAKQLAAALGFIGLVRADRVRTENYDMTMQQGMTYNIEITPVDKEGVFGIFYSRSFAITASGHDDLTPYPIDEILVAG